MRWTNCFNLIDESIKEDFFGAAHILSQLSHYNVLRLLGVCTTSPFMVLIPYMELGDLKRYLTRYIPSTYKVIKKGDTPPSNWGLGQQI